MAKIFLPTQYVNYDCKVVNNDYIRVYTTNYTNWVDIYVNQDYMLKSGYSQYGQNNVVCDTLNTYTDEVYYRVDFPFILLGFIILCVFCFYIPLRIFSKCTRRGSIC